MSLVPGRGVTGFETDIRLTKDGHLVIMHDEDVARVSDGTGVVEELTLAELKKFRLNNSSDEIPTPEEMMTPLKKRRAMYKEVCEIFKDYSVFIGDDFADGGGDSSVRIKGMDHIVINDYRKFASAVSVLLK